MCKTSSCVLSVFFVPDGLCTEELEGKFPGVTLALLPKAQHFKDRKVLAASSRPALGPACPVGFI
jgi:hypothetical protein